MSLIEQANINVPISLSLDVVETVRDQIAAILAVESKNQREMALADDPQRDPDPYQLRIFKDRTQPWDFFKDENASQVPVINVSIDSDAFLGTSTNINNQDSEAVFNVDCYANGFSEETADGQVISDEDAARRAWEAARLVRRIITGGPYQYLKLRGTVGSANIKSRTPFQPEIDERPIQGVRCVRIVMQCRITEKSPQFAGEPLELLEIVATKASGEVILKIDYAFPLP